MFFPWKLLQNCQIIGWEIPHVPRPRRLHSSVPAMSSSQISRPGAESTAATAAKAWEALEVTPLGLGIKMIYPLS